MKGNTGEFQGNVWEWVQCARGMLGNAGECQGNVLQWVQTARGMHGKGRRMPGEHMGVSVKCQGNAGE